MKKVLIGAGVVVVILIAAVIALPFLIPASTYRDVIEKQLEASLGRNVTFEKDPQIKFFPQLGASFDGVTIANAKGFDAPHFAKAESMSVAVKWLPLLSKRVEIASANFIGAEVFLEENTDGTVNWELGPETPADETDVKDDEATDPGFDALIPKASLKNSRISYVSKASKLDYDVTEINLEASLAGLAGPVSVKGGLSINDEPFKIATTLTSLENIMNGTPFSVDASIKSAIADLSYVGSVTTGEMVSFDGDLAATVNSLNRALQFAGIPSELNFDEVGSIEITGKVSGTPEDLSAIDLRVSQNGKNLNTTYTGAVSVKGENIRPDGAFTLSAQNLQSLATSFGIDLQGAEELGTVRLAGEVTGTLDDLSVNALSLDQKGKNLVTSFAGDLSVRGKDVRPTGTLSLVSSNVKALASAFGVELTGADASAFKTLNTDLKLKPAKSGVEASIQTFQFDAISATGTLGFDLSPEVPYIAVNLSLPSLDLSPYLVETQSSPQKGAAMEGWSKDPIDLSVLKSVNGLLNLTLGSVANQRAEILDVKLNSQIQNGSLKGSVTSAALDTGRSAKGNKLNPLHDGSLTTNFVLTSISETNNRLSFSAKGSGIAADDLVKFFTGLNVLNGVADIDASAKTQGGSISDFVQNLSGTYTAQVADGAIIGINLAQLVRSAQEALTTGKLPSALSPEQQTDFSSLSLKGDIDAGKTNVELFQLLSPYLQATATGTVDLFNQTLDIRLNSKAVTNATGKGSEQGLGGIGIPLRISGSWSNVSGSLDMDYMQKLAADQAKAKLKTELEDKVGSKLDNFLKKSLGGTESKEETPTDETGDPEKTEEKSDAEKAKDLLKGLLGNRN